MENRKHLILIADDDQNFREILGLKLKSLGFDVVNAADGKEALDKLQTIKSDLIVLDLKMPVMDGVETLDKIKSHDSFKNVRAIFLSNYGENIDDYKGTDNHFASQLGAISYVRKSDDLEKIVTVLTIRSK